jgi:hypothetical protein
MKPAGCIKITQLRNVGTLLRKVKRKREDLLIMIAVEGNRTNCVQCVITTDEMRVNNTIPENKIKRDP